LLYKALPAAAADERGTIVPRKKPKRAAKARSVNHVVEMVTANVEIRKRVLTLAAKHGEPLTTQAIDQWKYLPNGVPPRRVRIVAAATGLQPHQIRPDIFPHDHHKN
jgi:hypothetical protein